VIGGLFCIHGCAVVNRLNTELVGGCHCKVMLIITIGAILVPITRTVPAAKQLAVSPNLAYVIA